MGRMSGVECKGRQFGRAGLVVATCVLAGLGAAQVRVRAAEAGAPGGGSGADVTMVVSAKDLVLRVLAVEGEEIKHKGHYVYLSQERSERTGGHLWTERVAETSVGKVRRLIAEDGQPLTGERAAAEHARLMDIAADPEAFRRRSEALKNDEQHAKEMLDLLPKAFLLEGMRQEGEFVRIDYKPNPDFVPQSVEQRVMHGMVGTLLVDAKVGHLHSLEGRLPADVNIGFGLLATIKAGSNFSTMRDPVPGNEWKTSVMNTDITGRAIFFKAIGKKQHAEHSAFVQVPMDITVPQAV